MQTRSQAIPAESKLAEDSDRRKLPIPAALLLLSLVFPFLVQVGPLLMSVNRLVLLVMVIPCFFMWLSGRAGPIRTADIALMLMWLWITISFLVNHDLMMTIEASGIRFIETLGAYLLARCYIRDAESFHAMVSLLFMIIVAMLPFAIYESLTGHNILLDVANSIWFSGHDAVKQPRWGLDRVEGVLVHPILFGVFCGVAISLVYYVLGYGVSFFKRVFKTSLVGLTALFSLSAGPLLAILAQVLLIGWDQALSKIKARWKILTGAVLSFVVALEIAANRTTPELFIPLFRVQQTLRVQPDQDLALRDRVGCRASVVRYRTTRVGARLLDEQQHGHVLAGPGGPKRTARCPSVPARLFLDIPDDRFQERARRANVQLSNRISHLHGRLLFGGMDGRLLETDLRAVHVPSRQRVMDAGRGRRQGAGDPKKGPCVRRHNDAGSRQTRHAQKACHPAQYSGHAAAAKSVMMLGALASAAGVITATPAAGTSPGAAWRVHCSSPLPRPVSGCSGQAAVVGGETIPCERSV